MGVVKVFESTGNTNLNVLFFPSLFPDRIIFKQQKEKKENAKDGFRSNGQIPHIVSINCLINLTFFILKKEEEKKKGCSTLYGYLGF